MNRPGFRAGEWLARQKDTDRVMFELMLIDYALAMNVIKVGENGEIIDSGLLTVIVTKKARN